MKIVATLCDVNGVVHAGALPETRSYIIDIPDDCIPQQIARHVQSMKDEKLTYEYLQLSPLLEETHER